MERSDTPRRRWFTWRLRTMLLLVLVVGFALGWVINRAERQRKAVDWLRTVRGSVIYDHQLVNGQLVGTGRGPRLPFQPDAEPPGPKWLRRIIGDDFFQTVVEVGFGTRGLEFEDEDLAHLAALDRLRLLNVGGTRFDDRGLAHLKGLKRLEFLQLASTEISDAGLVHLKGLERLETLGLGFNTITDVGVAHLKGLDQLQSLDLSNTKISNAGLGHLSDFRNLQEMILHGDLGLDYDAVQELKEALPGTTVRYVPPPYRQIYEGVRADLRAGLDPEAIRAKRQTMIDRSGPAVEETLREGLEDALAGRPPKQ